MAGTTIMTILAAGWLLGCGSTTYRGLNPPNDQEAIVHIIRQRAEPTAWSLDVTVDGDKAAELSNNSHVKFSVPAGRRTIRFGWPKLASTVSLETVMEFNGREIRYFLVSGTARLTRVSKEQSPMPLQHVMKLDFTETLELVELSPSDGERLLRDMAGAR